MPTTIKNIPTRAKAEELVRGYLADGCTLVKLDALNKETTWTYKCDDSCDKLKAYWMPGGTVNAANKERLEQLMSKNGLVTGPGRIMNLIYSAEFARFRKLFVDELKL